MFDRATVDCLSASCTITELCLESNLIQIIRKMRCFGSEQLSKE